MIMHIDPDTGSPSFVLDQMMMIKSLNAVYQKYGIHGIYYCVLFGWPASPFAMVTEEKERHELVVKEVYDSKYYDPIIKEEIYREKLQVKDQYKEAEIIEAISSINTLARVPVLEDKALYLKQLDKNKAAMDYEHNMKDVKGTTEREKYMKDLIANRKALNAILNEALISEKDTLLKKDPKASLDDFINLFNNSKK